MDNKLIHKIGINLKDSQVISFVGGGGKTTLITDLCKELKGNGKKVLWTTSTAIGVPDKDHYDEIFIGDLEEDYIPKKSSVTVYGEDENKGKLRSYDLEKINEIADRKIFDYILIEADGAKRKPIKAPNKTEPVISPYTDITIGLIGINALGKEIDTIVHRSNIFRDLLDINEDIYLEASHVVDLVKNENGLFQYCIGKKVLYLNKIKDDDLDNVQLIVDGLENLGLKIVMGKHW